MARFGTLANLHLSILVAEKVCLPIHIQKSYSSIDLFAVIWKHAGRDATTSYSSIHAPSILPNNLDPSKLKGSVDKESITAEWAKPPPTATPELRLHEKPPLETVISTQDFEDIAQRTISNKTWAFYSSADTGCLTRDRNKEYFGRIWFRPRLLRNVREVSTKSTMLGLELGMPLFVSPAAMAKLVDPEGEKGIARGCVPNRVAQSVSNNASFPMEDIMASVPKEANHPFFFQFYVNKNRSKSEALLKHIKSLGIAAIFVTVDAPVAGKREADERVKADESISTPMSGAQAKNDKRGGGLGRIMAHYIADDFAWDEFVWLRQHWDGKIVVKGIQSWQDANRCADEGMDGVMLSNHGGRNLDT